MRQLVLFLPCKYTTPPDLLLILVSLADWNSQVEERFLGIMGQQVQHHLDHNHLLNADH